MLVGAKSTFRDMLSNCMLECDLLASRGQHWCDCAKCGVYAVGESACLVNTMLSASGRAIEQELVAWIVLAPASVCCSRATLFAPV